MKDDVIPLVWDTGAIGSVAVDDHGELYLRHAIDHDMARQLELVQDELGLASLAPPFHVAPSIVNGADLTALMHELARLRR